MTDGTSQTPPRTAAVPAALMRNEIVAAIAVAAVAAIAVPGSRAGIGLAVAALAVIAFAVSAAGGRDLWRTAVLVSAATLALTPLIRDASWLVTANLCASVVLCGVALTAGRSWRSLWASPASLLSKLPPAPGAVIRGALLVVPSGGGASVATALRGTAIAGGLVVVFGALFASADGAFAEIAASVAPNAGFAGDLPARIGAGLLAASLAGAIALSSGPAVSDPSTPSPRTRRRLAPLEWGIPLAALTALFATFVAVQFVVLFGGSDRVLETADLTFSEYAREGFWQLLFVIALLVGVIAIARSSARAETRGQRLALRILLVTLCLLALVVAVSALHRLDLYADAFGATRQRLWAATACASLAGFVALLAAAIVADRDEWLPRATALAAALVLIALTTANPDALIAERNVDRFEREERFDIAYAATLSADATPALAGLPPELAAEALAAQRARLSRDDGPFGINLSRESARDAVASLP